MREAWGGEDDDVNVCDVPPSRADRRAWFRLARMAGRSVHRRGITAPAADSLHAVQDAFEDAAGVERGSSSRRISWQRFRNATIATTALVVAGGAWTVANPGFIADHPNAPRDARKAPVRYDPLLGLARVVDPVASERVRWGMRAFVDPGKRRCVIVGQIVAGRVGRVAAGQFSEYPADAPRQCLPARHHLFFQQRHLALAGDGQRTVFYGVADRSIRRLGVGAHPPGREIPIADDGTFLYVVVGIDTFSSANAYVTTGSGMTSEPLGVETP